MRMNDVTKSILALHITRDGFSSDDVSFFFFFSSFVIFRHFLA